MANVAQVAMNVLIAQMRALVITLKSFFDRVPSKHISDIRAEIDSINRDIQSIMESDSQDAVSSLLIMDHADDSVRRLFDRLTQIKQTPKSTTTGSTSTWNFGGLASLAMSIGGIIGAAVGITTAAESAKLAPTVWESVVWLLGYGGISAVEFGAGAKLAAVTGASAITGAVGGSVLVGTVLGGIGYVLYTVKRNARLRKKKCTNDLLAMITKTKQNASELKGVNNGTVFEERINRLIDGLETLDKLVKEEVLGA